MANHPSRIQTMLDTLKRNSLVTGIIGRKLHPGRYLIMVVLEQRLAQIESLYSTVGGVVIEWKIRTTGDLRRAFPLSENDYLLLDGEVWFDRSGLCEPLWQETTHLWEAEYEAFDQHELDSLRFRCSQPLIQLQTVVDEGAVTDLLFHEAATQALEAHYWLRHQPFPGSASAARYWQLHEPELWKKLEIVLSKNDVTTRLTAAQQLADTVLQNVGGISSAGTVFPLGLHAAEESLYQEAERTWTALFGGNFMQ